MRFSLRFQKLCYAGGACLCLAAALMVVIWATSTSAVAGRDQVELGPIAGIAATKPDKAREPSREDFAKLCERPLRAPLYDPPPPKPVIRELPPLRVELLGTILEDANSMAIIRSEKGDVQYKRLGDAVGPESDTAKVIEIDSNSIVVEREKQRVTLKVQSKGLQ